MTTNRPTVSDLIFSASDYFVEEGNENPYFTLTRQQVLDAFGHSVPFHEAFKQLQREYAFHGCYVSICGDTGEFLYVCPGFDLLPETSFVDKAHCVGDMTMPDDEDLYPHMVTPARNLIGE